MMTMITMKNKFKDSYLQSKLLSSSKLVKFSLMICPGGSWMSHSGSILFGYFFGCLGEVITPLGSVSVPPGTVNEEGIQLFTLNFMRQWSCLNKA